MSKFLKFGLIVLSLGMACLHEAYACSVTSSVSSASFGQFSSIEITNVTPATSANPSAGIECEGAVLGLLGGLLADEKIEATVTGMHTSAGSFQLAHTSGDIISYQAYADPSYNVEIMPNVTVNYANQYLLELLGLFGTGATADMPMYFLVNTTAGLNLTPGIYTDTLSIFWEWSRCPGISLLGICLGYDTGTAVTSINVSLQVEGDCLINAPNVNFGAVPLVGEFNSVTQTIEIRCSKSTPFSVGINQGVNADGSLRRLSNGTGHLIYDLFKGAAGTEVWGNQGLERRTSDDADTNAGVYDGVLYQGFIYRAAIRSNQPTPPAGTYTDTLVIDVVF